MLLLSEDFLSELPVYKQIQLFTKIEDSLNISHLTRVPQVNKVFHMNVLKTRAAITTINILVICINYPLYLSLDLSLSLSVSVSVSVSVSLSPSFEVAYLPVYLSPCSSLHFLSFFIQRCLSSFPEEEDHTEAEESDPEEKLCNHLQTCLAECSRQRLRSLQMSLRHYGNVDNRVTCKDMQTSLQVSGYLPNIRTTIVGIKIED